ncbi:MAG: chorismate mutase, partial [Betaproteobacteria bacterium]|nr:chorismate mutase [Betaproteobacteria bacterium]
MADRMDQPGLNDLRREIDEVDCELLRLLVRRAGIAHKVGELKAVLDAPVWRPEREAQVILGLQHQNEALGSALPPSAIAAIWTEVMSACRALER